MKEKIFNIKYGEETIRVSSLIREVGKEWIICFHGLQSNKQIFRPIFDIPQLKLFSVIVIDFVGFGDSDKPKNFSYTAEDQAVISKQIIDQLNAEKLHIIGHSLGGMVGTLLLEQLGERVVSFINLEGNLIAKDCGASADVAMQSFEDFQQSGFAELKSTLKQSNEVGALQRLAWVEQIPGYAFYKTSVSIVQISKSEKLLNLFLTAPQKKLYIYGDKNAFKIEVLEHKVPVEKISNAGHFMLLENSQETWDKVIMFLTH